MQPRSMDAKICGITFKQKQDIGTVAKYLPLIESNYEGKNQQVDSQESQQIPL